MSKLKKAKQNNPDIYDELVDFQDNLHKQNLKRIRIGLLCVLIIPMIFLSLMFITDSNKVIWLILWIVSLFAISAYRDYNLQHRVNAITGNEAEPVPILESGLNDMNARLASAKAEARDIIASAKASVAISDEDEEGAEDFVPEIDTDLIKESLDEENELSDEGSGRNNKDKKKKKDGKKDKKKKNKNKKKAKDKKKNKKAKKKDKKKVKEDIFNE